MRSPESSSSINTPVEHPEAARERELTQKVLELMQRHEQMLYSSYVGYADELVKSDDTLARKLFEDNVREMEWHAQVLERAEKRAKQLADPLLITLAGMFGLSDVAIGYLKNEMKRAREEGHGERFDEAGEPNTSV